MDAERVQREILELKAVIEALENRVATLEQGRPAIGAGDAARDTPEPPAAAGHTVSTFFARLAAVSFALVGALILRVAAQHGWLNAAVGTWLGLAYCAALLGAPFLARAVPPLSPHVTVLQYCGVFLVPLLVLETFHKTGTLGRDMAAAILIAAASSGGLAGLKRGLRGLSAAGLLLPLFALAGLGATPDGAALRAAGIAWCAALAFLIAHRRNWWFLRPALLVPAFALLGLGVIMTARREGLPAHVPPAILGASICLAAVVGLNHLRRRRALGVAEWALLPISGAWAYGLLFYFTPKWAPPAGLIAGAATLAAAAAILPRARTFSRAFGGAVATAAVLTGLALPSVDATGIGLAAAALAVQALGRKGGSMVAELFSQSLAVEAAAVALLAPRFYSATGGTASAGAILASAAVGGGLLLLHFRLARAGEAGGAAAPAARAAPLSLVAGLAVCYFAARGAAFVWLGAGPAFGLAQTLILAASAAIVLCAGFGTGSAPVYYVGLGGVLLAAAKVVFWDLVTLEGSHLLASVVTLGIESVITALVIRRRGAAAGATSDR